jgi:hypothetical protein
MRHRCVRRLIHHPTHLASSPHPPAPPTTRCMVTCHRKRSTSKHQNQETASTSPSQVTRKRHDPLREARRVEGGGERDGDAHVQQRAGAALKRERHRRRLQRVGVLRQVHRRLPQQRRLARSLHRRHYPGQDQ